MRSAPAIDIPASDQVGEADQPLRDQFAMLDDVTGMRDDAGAQHFPFRYLHALEQVVLVFVARIGCLEAERTGIDLEHVLDDLGQVTIRKCGPSCGKN